MCDALRKQMGMEHDIETLCMIILLVSIIYNICSVLTKLSIYIDGHPTLIDLITTSKGEMTPREKSNTPSLLGRVVIGLLTHILQMSESHQHGKTWDAVATVLMELNRSTPLTGFIRVAVQPYIMFRLS